MASILGFIQAIGVVLRRELGHAINIIVNGPEGQDIEIEIIVNTLEVNITVPSEDF